MSAVARACFILPLLVGTAIGGDFDAAIAVSLTVMGRPEQPIEVHVDRPFLFAIQDAASGTCLFFGRITDPRF
jgi:serine protease inhibitor